MGVVTNGSLQAQSEKIGILQLADMIDALVISETVGYKKPDPRIFIAALAELGLKNSETMFVGDHPTKGSSDNN